MLALALGGKKWPSFSADSPSHDDDNNNNNNPRVCFRKRSSAKITSSESTRTICMPARLACLPARSWRLRNLCQRDGRFRPASQRKGRARAFFGLPGIRQILGLCLTSWLARLRNLRIRRRLH